MTQRILITGGSGFIGGHCVQAALDAGYDVRTTARSTAHADALKARFSAPERVEVVAADLGSDTGWREAMDGVDGVLHVASPLPHGEPKDPDEVIRPAVDGTLRVLRAATDAGVRRVVFTSSFGAIGFGHSRHTLATHLFTEDDWAPLESRTLNTYDRSKTLAERAAWEYVQTTPGAPELAVLNPVAVIGSLRGSTPSGGNGVIAMMLQGKLPMLVETWFPIVDVRDVAQAELRALEVPEAAGHRFLISSGEGMTLPQIAGLLRDELGDRASQVPTRTLPTPLVRALAPVVPLLRQASPEVGLTKHISNAAMRDVLGVTPRPAREAVLSCAESLLDAKASSLT